MAFRLATTGLPNTGKSFAWKFYNEDDLFAIIPSSKILHARTSNGRLVSSQPLQVKVKGNSIEDIAQQKNTTTYNVLQSIVAKDLPISDVETSGHFIQCSDINKVETLKLFVSEYMPQIKIVLNPDFTHYISYVIQTPQFQRRKAGGEAFARFWELAADTLRNSILVADQMRSDIIDVTEFHSVWNEDIHQFEIYTPAGNMLVDKFKPETYFDVMLYSYVLPYEQQPDETKRFHFMVIKKEGYDGRSIGMFTDTAKDGLIPNNMSIVIERLREYLM